MSTIQLKSKYFENVGKTPLQEYPRPQFKRESYLNLNGEWDFNIVKKSMENDFSSKILVPFSPESLLSGVNKICAPDDKLCYRRIFSLEKEFIKDKTLINFGGVDYECVIFINGVEVYSHKGGFLPFTVDITNYIKVGENELVLICYDPTETSYGATGKQKLNPSGIFYTPQSGIWQTVFIESVSNNYIKDVKYLYLPKENALEICIYADNFAGVGVEIKGDNNIYKKEYKNKTFKIDVTDFELWSPENPKLYDITFTVDGDKVESYFALRTFETCGNKFLLNGKEYFMSGVLDQGYYSDGLLTAPTAKALFDDVKLLKDSGFNCVRKHIKIESLLWYYYCDKLGLIVWQDMVCGCCHPWNKIINVALPFINIHLKDNRYKTFLRTNEAGKKEFIEETKQTINLLKNTPSIGVWTIFNEGWGQFDSIKVTDIVRSLDSSRIIDSTSGWHKQKNDHSDVISLHIYMRKVKIKKANKPVFLSECGGYTLLIKDHIYSLDKLFSYKDHKNVEELHLSLEKLYSNLQECKNKGLNAMIYTQLSDVEEEINGLITFDRKVVKFDLEKLKKLNDKLIYS